MIFSLHNVVVRIRECSANKTEAHISNLDWIIGCGCSGMMMFDGDMLHGVFGFDVVGELLNSVIIW